MIKLSAVIITLNEERNISRCLQSLQGIADELVVVDSFSSDKTDEICKSFGAKFIQNKFEGHIEQKNYALSVTSFDYVLSLDADEALSDELRSSIKNVKESWKHDGYEMNRLTNYCGQWIKHSSWYPDRKLRLFKKSAGKWGGENPHDRFEKNQNATIDFLKGDLLHYSFYSIADHVAQVNKFTDTMARAMHKRGKNVSAFTIVFSPLFKFVRNYFFKMGFLDGYYGFVICMISAHATFLKYVKLRQLQKTSL